MLMAITCIQIILAKHLATNTSSRMNGIIVVIHAMPIVEIALVLPHHHAPIVDPLTTS